MQTTLTTDRTVIQFPFEIPQLSTMFISTKQNLCLCNIILGNIEFEVELELENDLLHTKAHNLFTADLMAMIMNL